MKRKIYLLCTAMLLAMVAFAQVPTMQQKASPQSASSVATAQTAAAGSTKANMPKVAAKSVARQQIRKAKMATSITCAQAREYALSVSANNELYNNGAEYVARGYVTAIQTAFNPSFNNISFWMADTETGGKVIEAYRCAAESADACPAVGDLVEVTGYLTKYGTTPEFYTGCTFTMIAKAGAAVNLGPKTIAEFKALKNIKDTCVLTGVVTQIVSNIYGNVYIYDGTDSLYIYGVLTADGQSKQFESLDVAVGDTMTVKAIYGEYNNTPQAANAIFVSRSKKQQVIVETWGPVTVKLDPASVDSLGWANVGIWAWVTNGASSTNLFDLWPGVAVTKEEETGWWSYTFNAIPAGQLNIIWNDFGSYGYQTIDIENVAENTCYSLWYETDGVGHHYAGTKDCPEPAGPKNLGPKSISEFIALANTTDTCVLTGIVTQITNTTYGNLYINDGTDSLYIYGVLTSDGQAKQFASLDVAVGDTLTVKAVYSLFKEVPQAKNAVFVSRAKASGSVDPEPQPTGSQLTVAQALEKGLAMAQGETSTVIDTVVGYVFNPQTFNVSYMNQTWFMADDQNASLAEFEAYNCYPIDGTDTVKVLPGDKVYLVGKITHYYDKNKSASIIEIKNGNAGFISKVEGDRSVVKDGGSKTVAQAIEIGSQLSDGGVTEAQYEITGYVSSLAGTPLDYSKYGNQNFWITDAQYNIAMSNANGALYVWQGAAETAVKVGDKISIKTILKNYGGLVETEKNVTVTILSSAAVEDPITPFTLDLTTTATVIDGWRVENATEQTNDGSKWTYDIGAAVPSTSYAKDQPNVIFQIANTKGKTSAFNIAPGKYYEFSGKNGVVRVLNTKAGDIIKITGAAKGSTASNFNDTVENIYPINAVALSEDLVLPAKGSEGADGSGYVWKTIEWESQGGDVMIKEIAAGWRVQKIEVAHPEEPQPSDAPTVAPTAPTHAEADVMAIYSSYYTMNNANFAISGWAGPYQELNIDGTKVGYWTNMTWECIIDPVNTDAAHNYSAYEYIHVDMWAPTAAKIKFTAEAIASASYKDGMVVDLKQGWNSVDLYIADWGYDFSTLRCLVFEAYQTPAGESFEGNPFAFANIYFWKTPASTGAPTVADLAKLYDLNSNVVLAVKFTEDAEVCNPVHFVGTINNWGSGEGSTTSWSNCPTFEPLAGFDGWYVVSTSYVGDGGTWDCQGKPLQEESDGSWTWDYQCGDVDAWNYIGGNTMALEYGYDGECNVGYPTAGAYIYELKYWKKHKNPCTTPVKNHIYSVTMYSPNACPNMKPAIIGDFNDWTVGVPMNEYVTGQNDTIYLYQFTAKEGSSIKFKEATDIDWSNELQYYNAEYDAWYVFDNIELGADTALVFDWRDNSKYRYAQCVPEAIVVNCTEPMSMHYYSGSLDWQVIGENDVYQISFDFFSDNNLSPAGTYTNEKMDLSYTWVRIKATDTYYYASYAEANVWVSGDTTYLSGILYGKNGNNYEVHMFYAAPAAGKSETVAVENANLDDYGNSWQIRGYNADKTCYVALAAYNGEVAGAYTIGNLALDYTYIVKFVNGDTLKYNTVEANLTVTYNAETQIAFVTGTLRGQNINDATDVIDFTLYVGAVLFDPYSNDVANADIAVNFNNYIVDTDYYESEGMVRVFAQNDSTRSYLALVLYTSDASLVAGTYTINFKRETGTALASAGAQSSSGGVNYSLVANYDEDGNFADIWYFVQGNVIVGADGSIDITAFNSRSRSIQIHVAAPPQPETWGPVTVKLDPTPADGRVWNSASLYAWTTNDAGSKIGEPLGAWPGKVVSKDEATGWWSYTFEEVTGNLNIIWGNSEDGVNINWWTLDINNVEGNTCYQITGYDDLNYAIPAVAGCPEPVYQGTVMLYDVANYIDFQALSVSDPAMTSTTITSTNTYTLANGTVLKGFQKSDGTEVSNTWNVKNDYNIYLPTPEWEGVDSLMVGTMFSAASGTTLTLGELAVAEGGKLAIYFQPNGNADRGVSVTIKGGDPIEYLKSGVKIDGIRPGYKAEFDLPAGSYDAGDVVIKVAVNTINIFGIGISGQKPYEPTWGPVTVRLDAASVAAQGWGSVGIWAWVTNDNSSVDLFSVWPGAAATLGSDGWWSYTFDNIPMGQLNILWNEYDGNRGWQTYDIQNVDDNMCFALGNNDYNEFWNVSAVECKKLQVLTVAEALAMGEALDQNTGTEDEYIVEGYVVNAEQFSLNQMNQIWWMADDASNTKNQAFESYYGRAIMGNDTLKVLNGDKVQLRGHIYKYQRSAEESAIIEIKYGVATFISMVEGDHSIRKETETVNVSRALEIAGQLAENASTDEQYIVYGYVTAMIGSADGGYAQYGNQNFWIADVSDTTLTSNAAGALEVYQGVAEQQIKVGDLISVKAQLRNYKGLLETYARGKVTLVYRPGVTTDVPTESDLKNAGYDTDSCIVLAVRFVNDAVVCNPIVFAGNYCGWTSDPSQMVWFAQLKGFEDWYVAQIPYNKAAGEYDNMAKPVQLRSNGTFSWDYQPGGISAWTHKGGQATDFEYYEGSDECTPYFYKPGGYIYEINHWANYSNPCGQEAQNYTAQIYLPNACPVVEPALYIRNTGYVDMTPVLDSDKAFHYVAKFNAFADDFCYIIDKNDYTELLHFDGEGWYTATFYLPKDSVFTVDCSDNELYRFAGCAAPEKESTVNVTLRVPEYAPESVEIIGNFVDSIWSHGIPMVYDEANDKWNVTIKAKPSDYFKFRQAGTWDNELQYLGNDSAWWNFPNMMFQDYWQTGDNDSTKVMSLDFSDGDVYRWKQPNIPTDSAVCYYEIDMTDTYGDGWNGGIIHIVDGKHHMYYTMSEGSHARVQVPYYNNEVHFYWTSGYYVDEVGFDIIAANGMGLYHHEARTEMPTGLFYTMYDSPCDMGYNQFNPQNIQATLNENKCMVVTWDEVAAAASYRVNISGPYDVAWNYTIDKPSATTGVVNFSGDYLIQVMACDAEGMQIGASELTVPIKVPSLGEVTVSILVPTDCGMDFSNGMWMTWRQREENTGETVKMTQNGRIFSATFDPKDSYYYIGLRNTETDSTSTQYTYYSGWTLTNLCAEVLYSESNVFSISRRSDCNLVDHDYRVSNLKANSVAGRVDFSWTAKDVATQYLVSVFYAEKGDDITTLYVNGSKTEVTWAVPDWYDNTVASWSVTPQYPYTLSDVMAPDSIILHKSQVEFVSGNVMTKDSASLQMNWKFNTDTLKYLVEIEYNGTVIKRAVVSDTTYNYNGMIRGYHYSYVQPLNQKGEVVGERVSLGYVNMSKVEDPVYDLKGEAVEHDVTFSWKKKAGVTMVQAEIFKSEENGSYILLADSVMTVDQWIYTVEEDGLYLLQIYPYLEVEPGQSVLASYVTHTAAQVFTGKTFHVELSSTEGGYIWPEGLSGDYPEGYQLPQMHVNTYSGYRFVGWSDGVTETYRTIVVDKNITLKAIFEKIATYELSVKATEGGTVYNGMTGSYDTAFVARYQENETIYLSANAESGYTFEKWSDGVTSEWRNIQLTQDTALTAIFHPYVHLTIRNNIAGGYIGVSGNWYGYEYTDTTAIYSFAYGSDVQLTANPYDGYRFAGWSNGEKSLQCMVTMNGDVEISAKFEKAEAELKQYEVKITTTGKGQGYFNMYQDWISGTYYEGTEMTVTAYPQENSIFVEWSDGKKDNPRKFVVNDTINIQARFDIKQISLTVRAEEGGKIVKGESGTYDYGTEVVIAAEANAHYNFTGWSDGRTSNPRTVYLYQDTVITAQFEAIPQYSLSVEAEKGGKILVAGMKDWGTKYTDQLDQYSMVSVRAQADSLYRFIGWSDGVMAQQRTLIMTKNYDIKAQFERLPIFQLTLRAGEGGKVMANGMTDYGTTWTQSYDQSELVNLSAKANDGYAFVQWSDGNKDASRSLYLTKDTVLEASFLPVRKLTLTAEVGGSILFEGQALAQEGDVYTVVHGAVVNLTAVPAEGYRFISWSDTVKTLQRTLTVTADLSLKAQFAVAGGDIKQYEVKVGVSGDGQGTVSNVSGTYYEGDVIEVAAIAAENSEFVCWSDSITTNPRTITVDKNITLNAIFVIKQISLTISATEGGVVNDSAANGIYPYGTSVLIKATPNESFHFAQWSDGNTTPSRYIILTQDTALVAQFEGDMFTITFKNYNDSILEQKQWRYGAMPSCSVTPTRPDEGTDSFVFIGWTPEITVVKADAEYKATYKTVSNAFTVTFWDWDGSVIDKQTVLRGNAATLPANPVREGYIFKGWSVDSGDLNNVQQDIDAWAEYEEAQGLNDVENDLTSEKIFRDGHFYILRGGKVYTLQGQEVK